MQEVFLLKWVNVLCHHSIPPSVYSLRAPGHLPNLLVGGEAWVYLLVVTGECRWLVSKNILQHQMSLWNLYSLVKNVYIYNLLIH